MVSQCSERVFHKKKFDARFTRSKCKTERFTEIILQAQVHLATFCQLSNSSCPVSVSL